jgi:hypothetical protein
MQFGRASKHFAEAFWHRHCIHAARVPHTIAALLPKIPEQIENSKTLGHSCSQHCQAAQAL